MAKKMKYADTINPQPVLTSVYPEMASFTQCRRWADNLNPQNIPIFLRFKLSARRACPAAPGRGSWAIPPWRDYHFWMDTN
jgi:hypothetical protein